MKVVSIGTDRKLFEEGSAVLERTLSYASKMEGLHIIVFTQRGFSRKTIGNLHIYPTNSLSRFLYIKDAERIGGDILKNNKIDVISTQDPFETGLVGYELKKRFKVPLQLQIHTDFLSPYFKNSFLNRIRVMLAQFLIPKADGIRVVSSIIRDSLKSKFQNIIVDILPVFVDIEKINARQSTDFDRRAHIVMASRLSSEKRIDVAIQAMKIVASKVPNVDLIIFGNGSEKDTLEKLATSLSISNRVTFSNWENDLNNIYNKADVFLLTSEYEGYGMTLIEAGAAGCPIVTTAVGVAKTDLFKDGENSFVCPVGDVDCLAHRLIELLSNPSKRDLFKQAMQDSIRNDTMSKEKYVSRYVELLEKLQK